MDTENKDYYAVIGVSRNATPEEIKKQYRKLVKECKLDALIGIQNRYQKENEVLAEILKEKIDGATAQGKLLNEAYDILSDPAKRNSYDREIASRKPNAVADSKPDLGEPEIVIDCKGINFGRLEADESKIASFVVDNQGGPADQINFDWEIKPVWAEFEPCPKDPVKVFPILVKVSVKALDGLEGKQSANILVDVDGKIQKVAITYRSPEKIKPTVPDAVVSDSVPAAPPSTPSGVKLKPIAIPVSKRTAWILAIVALLLFVTLFIIERISFAQRSQNRAMQEAQDQQALAVADQNQGTLVVNTPYGDVTITKLKGLFTASEIQSCVDDSSGLCADYFKRHRGFWAYEVKMPDPPENWNDGATLTYSNGENWAYYFWGDTLNEGGFTDHSGDCFLESWEPGVFGGGSFLAHGVTNWTSGRLYCKAEAGSSITLLMQLQQGPNGFYEFNLVLDHSTGMIKLNN